MCTAIRFSDKSGNLHLARNLDWNTRYGERVALTPMGYDVSLSFLEAMPARFNITADNAFPALVR